MTRNRASAKQAGARFNRQIADYLKAATGNDDIDKTPLHGAKDIGDVANLKIHGQRIAVECKDCQRVDLPGWTREAKAEARNYGALAGLVVFKRRGVADPSAQWVAMTLADLVAIITGVSAND